MLRTIHYLIIIIVLLMVTNHGLTEETPISGSSASAPSSSGTYTGFVETTYDDPNWVLVISDGTLRVNVCDSLWYEKVFEPCHLYNGEPRYNRYWNLELGAETGRAFPMSTFGDVDLDPSRVGTLDGLSEIPPGTSAWSDLLDGQGTIGIGYEEYVILFGYYVETGTIALESATLMVEGVIIPEPATILLMSLGSLILRRHRDNKAIM